MSKFDVLRPQLHWIGDQCFRKFEPRQNRKDDGMEGRTVYSGGFEQFDDEDDGDDIVIAHEGNDFYATKQIPTILYNQVRSNIRKLNRVMNVDVTTPNVQSQDFVELSVRGKKDRDVKEAIRRITLLVEEGRLKMQFSHFITFPMNFPNVIESFLKFKEDVLQNCREAKGLDASIFQNPEKLHLTITTLLLVNKMEKEQAAAVLQSCQEEISTILRGDNLVVQVRGVEYMNDDPEEVDILYAKVQEKNNNCLERISELLLKKFRASKLIHNDDHDNVRLHITLMNSLFRQDEEGAPEESNFRRRKERETFDARPILEKCKNFDFGVVTLSKIHITIRFTKGKDGYYLAESVLNI